MRKAFQNNGFSFLLKVFNELNYLEDLTGLRAMQLATDLSEVKKKTRILFNKKKINIDFFSSSR